MPEAVCQCLVSPLPRRGPALPLLAGPVSVLGPFHVTLLLGNVGGNEFYFYFIIIFFFK